MIRIGETQGNRILDNDYISTLTRNCNDEAVWLKLKESRKKKGENGAPGGIRTPNLLIRSQVLYPVELRAHCLRNGV